MCGAISHLSPPSWAVHGSHVPPGLFQPEQSHQPPAPLPALCPETFHQSPLTKVPFLHERCSGTLSHQQTLGAWTKVPDQAGRHQSQTQSLNSCSINPLSLLPPLLKPPHRPPFSALHLISVPRARGMQKPSLVSTTAPCPHAVPSLGDVTTTEDVEEGEKKAALQEKPSRK